MKIFNIMFPKQILFLLALAVGLNLFRHVVFGASSFVYLLWNIFLAALPFLVSSILLLYARKNKLSRLFLLLGGIVWLLLLPNAPYIVTDLIHVSQGRDFHVFYNTVLLFSSALVGLLLGLYSLFHMEEILKMRYSPKKSSIILIFIMLLASFGICLGRFLRFNSWDIVTNPIAIFKSIFNIFAYPSLFMQVYLLTAAFFVLIFFSYHAWKSDMRMQ